MEPTNPIIKSPPKPDMRASKNAIDLIKQFEGCRLEAYQDSGGVWTVGWGSTGPGITERTVISQGVADGMLKSDVAVVSEAVGRLVGISCNQNMFDSLVSFAYNVGVNALKGSTLLKLLLAGHKEKAADEFLKWNHVNGQVVAGLTSRREAERKLFLA